MRSSKRCLHCLSFCSPIRSSSGWNALFSMWRDIERLWFRRFHQSFYVVWQRRERRMKTETLIMVWALCCPIPAEDRILETRFMILEKNCTWYDPMAAASENAKYGYQDAEDCEYEEEVVPVHRMAIETVSCWNHHNLTNN